MPIFFKTIYFIKNNLNVESPDDLLLKENFSSVYWKNSWWENSHSANFSANRKKLVY